MKNYELVFIVQPTLDEEALSAFVARYTELVQSLGGQVTSVEPWGRRKLAYPIRKIREGYYYVTKIQMEPKAVSELERMLRINELVLRHLVVLQGE